ncbi:S1C family serine protease [Lacticaseibacillus pantheris]|jgi:serine protease Do|uniref:Serine protease n=1 Tax=Lacticaseibacillus pantheris DSM 15945 = JCM 12539 = NBRC 106106 TaxID=1423783 RepID=A0A0R1U5C8_9LACO|nr:trypsin-like peptidase domain-containing protein [Lacticaseibacillus pantheris]KRL86666.1 serine protease [Lacticaseibacillus pantheris DSM 15945 = JCM 12539 = NBRC 106106]WKF84084.1 trypsin-like peptidase domain-containing protein [Lacticaseibacillus pantheris]
MDKQNNDTQTDTNTKPKGNGVGKTATIAVVAALIGGGAGGGLAYYGFSRMSADNMGVTSKSGDAGTTAVTKTKSTSSASQSAFKKVKGAVVSVINLQKASASTNSDDGWGALFGDESSSSSSNSSSSGELTEYSEGSGVIYQKKDGYAYIVTNNHVVSGSDKLEVILSDGTKLTADKVGTDSVTDLAVLKIKGSKVKTVANFGNSNSISAGQTVLAVGSPLGTQYATSVTQGIVSAKKRTVDVTDSSGNTTNEATVIQTDAAINNGNSGGPLINLNGQVIGITSMKLSGSSSSSSDSATIEGMGFAIPSDEVVSIINQLVKNGKVVRPALGISVVSLSDISSDQQSELLNTPSSLKSGVVVAGFTSSSIAKDAGLAKYDVIVGLDDTKITDVADLHTALYKHKVGDTVKVTYYHGSTKKTASIKLTQTDESLSTSSSSSN